MVDENQKEHEGSTSITNHGAADGRPDTAPGAAPPCSWREAMFEGAPRFEDTLCAMFGLGRVYKAFDRKRSTRVAIKELLPTLSANREVLIHEFAMLRRIGPPAVPLGYDLLAGGQEIAIVMEWIEGVDFRSYLRNAPHDHARLRRAFAGLLMALVAVHDAGLVHRDVKAEHVLVMDEGRVVLLGLGLAVPIGTEITGGTIIGTPAYMAPEIFTCVPVSPARDLYAMGVMLFEALTGRLPFEGAHIPTMLAKKLHEEAPAPSSVAEDVPADLDRLCRALLDRGSTKRPSAEQVLAVLERR